MQFSKTSPGDTNRGCAAHHVPVGIIPGGADRDRTDDIQLAKLALSQLSYGPGTVQGTRIAAPPLIMSPARRYLTRVGGPG
jgi:hypothetical protein